MLLRALLRPQAGGSGGTSVGKPRAWLESVRCGPMTVSPKRAVEDLEKKAGNPPCWTLQDSHLTSLELGGEGR